MKKFFLFILILFFVLVLFGVCTFFTLPLKGDVAVLMYHYVVPQAQVGPTSLDVGLETFEKQMQFLRTFGFRPITIDQYYEIKTGKMAPKGREILITFDDGNESYWQYALPVLEKYQIPSVNFAVLNFLKHHQHGSMTLKKAKEIAKNPLVVFGSHSLAHSFLSDVDDRRARIEIFESKKKLERVLRKKIDYFCYPGGIFSKRDLNLVKEAGYKLAFTTSRKRLNGQPETLYSIVRSKVTPKDNLFVFWLRVSGLANWSEKIKCQYRQLTGKVRNGTLNAYMQAVE